MNINRVLIHLLYWILLLGLLMPAISAAKPTLHIGIVYRLGDTGTRIVGGIERAKAKYENDNGKFEVKLTKFPYLDETEGIDQLNKIFNEKSNKESIHMVLGPSDSGVFVNIGNEIEKIQNEDKESKIKNKKVVVPIVSPLVTAKEGNSEGDWRFRTNVDVEARARAAADFLSHASYQAIGVLYRNNKFGNNAAEAFKIEVAQPEEDYLALPYKDEGQLREQVRKIIEQRPGAVGVFGRRHELKVVKREIEALNSGWFEYRPLLFSINDTRALELSDTYFVSLIGPNKMEKKGKPTQAKNETQKADESTQAQDATHRVKESTEESNKTQSAGKSKDELEKWDEVKGLSYDTTLLVLDVAEQIRLNPVDKDWAYLFKKSLLSRMFGPPQPDDRYKTGMEFSDGKNVTPPIILTRTADSGEQIAVAGHSVEKLWKLGDWIEIRERRYGLAIWFNLILVASIALWLTMADIGRRQDIRSRVLYFSPSVITLAMFNIVSAVATLIVAAETNIMRWDNVLAALGVALGHRAMLTTTIFETAQGRALGFGRLYEKTLASINERIMMSLYEKQSAAINYVTYNNSLPNMRDLLSNIYGYAQDGPGSLARLDKLDAEIARAKGTLKKQEVCARRLLQTMSWKQLQQNRLIPEYIKQNELIDPNVILWEAVRFILQGDQAKKDKFDNYIQEALADIKRGSVESHKLAELELKDALEKAATERGRIYCRMRWLLTQWGFSLRRIRQEGLLPPNFRVRRGKISLRVPGWHRGKNTQPTTDPVETNLRPNNMEQHDRREKPRVGIDAVAQLVIKGEDQMQAHELDACIQNVSAGGAKILIKSDVLKKIPEELSALTIHIPEGLLAGIEDDVKPVYELSCDQGIQLGIEWSTPTAEVCKRVRHLAA